MFSALKSRRTRKISRVLPRLEELETRALPSGLVSSTNWSGYAAFASPANSAVTAVSGTWSVPTVTPGPTPGWSSSWVGIDGFNSGSVEQIGTEQDITSSGTAQYYAWYEMYPKGLVQITSMTIKAGDQISASVTYDGSGKFTLSITDGSQSYSTTQSAKRAKRSSAEWIEEAPSSIFGVLPLANFGTVNFSNAKATLNGTTGPIDGAAWQNDAINMVNSSGTQQLDSTSGLTDSGGTSSFSISTITAASTLTGTGGGSHKHSPANLVTNTFPNLPAAPTIQNSTTVFSVVRSDSQTLNLTTLSQNSQIATFPNYLKMPVVTAQTEDEMPSEKQEDPQGDGSASTLFVSPSKTDRVVDGLGGTMSRQALDDFFADPVSHEQNTVEEVSTLVGSTAPAIDVLAGAELSAVLLGAYLGNPIKAKETEDNTKRKVKWL